MVTPIFFATFSRREAVEQPLSGHHRCWRDRWPQLGCPELRNLGGLTVCSGAPQKDIQN